MFCLRSCSFPGRPVNKTKMSQLEGNFFFFFLSRRSNKSKAPTPPLVAQNRGAGPRPPQRLPSFPPTAMEQKENLIDRDLTLTVVLPAGLEKTTIVHGSKPMMDLLVMLCAKYHLNPSSHTIELISTNRNHIKFKPNALIGALEVEKILLKPKGADKGKKMDPHVPEATVRLVINYRRTQKTILRVNPRVPLRELLAAVCEKCEFQQKTTVLSRDVQSEEPLDLSKSLNDFGLRELYARDAKENCPVNLTSSAVNREDKSPQSKEKTLKEKENKGLFSMFRRSKKRPDQVATASAPASPVLSKQSRSTGTTSSMPSDVPKKRRAPLPPMLMSQSFPSNLNNQHQTHSPPSGLSEDEQISPGLSCRFPSEFSLKRSKRKAPPPPCVLTLDNTQQDPAVIEGLSHNTLEEIHEQEEVPCSVARDFSASNDRQGDDGSISLSAEALMDSGKSEPASDPTDFEALSSSPSDIAGEDRKGDLSSDGKLSRDPVSSRDCAEKILNIEDRGIPRVESTETAVSPAEQMSDQVGQPWENGPLLNEDAEGCQTGIRAQGPAPPGAPTPEPTTQGAGKQASNQADSEVSFGEGPEQAGVPVEETTASLSRQSAGVHAGVGPESSFSSEETPLAEIAVMKKDMATSTEDLTLTESPSTSPQPREGLRKCPKLLAAANTPVYIKESEPKPKPSNELTRDYTPKVGLTTYTITPQKSLEKLRFFEVELTLESSRKPELAASNAEAVDETGGSQLAERRPELRIPVPAVGSELSGHADSGAGSYNGNHSETILPQTALGPAPIPRADDKSCKPPSSSARGPEGDPELRIKQKKIPPAIKPKPLSFHSLQHRRTPGHYVTSAAMRSASVQSPVGSQSQAPERALDKVSSTSLERRDEDFREGCRGNPGFAQPQSVPAKVSPTGLSLEKLRSFAAPRPYTPGNPSRFALAVSSAVKRSQSLTQGSSFPAHRMHPSCALTGPYSIREIKESPRRMQQGAEENRVVLPPDVGHPGQGAESAVPLEAVGTGEAKETPEACRGAVQCAAIVAASTVPNSLTPIIFNGRSDLSGLE
ncbi:cordon-bleu protein-like 1b isoform X1 [Scleropages formosus]|uniref:cordon-bleu protein-like 1b isoform X1 n=2 Tax=Scleropages formosus TaxID=113540 RepID=UPI0010FA7722|nr:cordon-bleu protein-like 1 isoform X1 [Scleropages formosus]